MTFYSLGQQRYAGNTTRGRKNGPPYTFIVVISGSELPLITCPSLLRRSFTDVVGDSRPLEAIIQLFRTRKIEHSGIFHEWHTWVSVLVVNDGVAFSCIPG